MKLEKFTLDGLKSFKKSNEHSLDIINCLINRDDSLKTIDDAKKLLLSQLDEINKEIEEREQVNFNCFIEDLKNFIGDEFIVKSSTKPFILMIPVTDMINLEDFRNFIEGYDLYFNITHVDFEDSYVVLRLR